MFLIYSTSLSSSKEIESASLNYESKLKVDGVICITMTLTGKNLFLYLMQCIILNLKVTCIVTND